MILYLAIAFAFSAGFLCGAYLAIRSLERREWNL